MKTSFLLLMGYFLFPILSVAAKKDGFFEGDSKHFIRTTVLQKGIVRLEACTLIDPTTLEAYCEQLADIPGKEFHAMRACTTAGLIAESAEVLYGAGTAVVGVLSSEFIVGIGLVVKAAGIEAHAVSGIKESVAKKKVFAEAIEKDRDHIIDQKFDLFVATTKKSIEQSFISCDAKGVKVTDQIVKAVLTPTQARFLLENTKDKKSGKL